MNKKKRTLGLKRKAVVIDILVVASLFMSVMFARYMMKINKDGLITTENFYFTSDLLKEENENMTYTIDAHASNFTIKLFNYADSKRKTLSPISYTVSVKNGSSNITSGNIKVDQKEVSIVITPDTNLQEDIVVLVKSTSPYEKTLKATFKRNGENTYSIQDASGNRSTVLKIVCNKSSQKMTLTLPKGVIPDQSDPNVISFENQQCIYRLADVGIYSLVLFKSNPDLNLTSSGSFEENLEINREGGA